MRLSRLTLILSQVKVYANITLRGESQDYWLANNSDNIVLASILLLHSSIYQHSSSFFIYFLLLRLLLCIFLLLFIIYCYYYFSLSCMHCCWWWWWYDNNLFFFLFLFVWTHCTVVAKLQSLTELFAKRHAPAIVCLPKGFFAHKFPVST